MNIYTRGLNAGNGHMSPRGAGKSTGDAEATQNCPHPFPKGRRDRAKERQSYLSPGVRITCQELHRSRPIWQEPEGKKIHCQKCHQRLRETRKYPRSLGLLLPLPTGSPGTTRPAVASLPEQSRKPAKSQSVSRCAPGAQLGRRWHGSHLCPGQASRSPPGVALDPQVGA